MKILKKGFSLAEILIALAIVSVIATMCFSVAKHGIERAYNMYVYTGYKGISDAIADANGNDIYVDQDNLTAANSFIQHLANVLSATSVVKSGNTLWITAPNGIQFGITKSPLVTQRDDDNNVVQQMTITMRVPIRKTTANGNSFNTYTLYYVPERYSALIPAGDLANRKDLLLFYIDDGIAGRTINGVYHRRTYVSGKEAFCRAYYNKYGGNLPILGIGGAFGNNGCSGFASHDGSVLVADPRKG